MKRFSGHAVRTPLIRYALDERIFLKPENLQPFGSYKIRGIESAVNAAPDSALAHGLSAASAGNMAQAVAFAARTLGISCQIYVPNTAPEVKKAAIRALGATLVERPFPEIWKIVQENRIADDPGFFIHPAFNENLLRGYATIGTELALDLPDMDAVVIPFGVGGLSLGVAAAIRRDSPSTSIFLAEPETAAPLHASLKAGRASSVERLPSFVDAIGVPEVLPAVFEKISALVEDSLVIPIRDAESAVANVYRNHRMIIEGAAGCALAAAETLAQSGRFRRIAALLSGGNIDPEVLKLILEGVARVP